MPPLIGIRCSRAYAISSSRPIFQSRTGREHLELRDPGSAIVAVDPDLVVSLAGAAVGDRVAAGRARVLDRELCDQRPGERREERIAAAVERVGLDRRQRRSRGRTPRARRRRSRRRPRGRAPCRRRRPSPRPAGRGRRSGSRSRPRSAPGSSAASPRCRGRRNRAAGPVPTSLGIGLIARRSAGCWRFAHGAGKSRTPGARSAIIMWRVHRFLRILSTALITAGLVVLADVGLTLAWKEPLSTHLRLDPAGQGRGRPRPSSRTASRRPPTWRRSSRRRRATKRRAVLLADAFADAGPDGRAGSAGSRSQRSTSTSSSSRAPTRRACRRGPGHYPDDRPFPGQGKTIGIAGHRTTYLAPFRRHRRDRATATRSSSTCRTGRSPTGSKSTRSSTRATSRSSTTSATSAWS